MKKYTVLCAGLCVAMIFTGCKSKESAYKQAYLQAKQKEEMQQQQEAQAEEVEANVVVPLQEKSTANTAVVDNADNIQVRQETVSVVNGGGLRNFSVVVGSFSLKANAEGLQQKLKGQGYDAQLVVNNNVSPAMYRVVATTFDSKADAASSRRSLENDYPGAWLLYSK